MFDPSDVSNSFSLAHVKLVTGACSFVYNTGAVQVSVFQGEDSADLLGVPDDSEGVTVLGKVCQLFCEFLGFPFIGFTVWKADQDCFSIFKHPRGYVNVVC